MADQSIVSRVAAAMGSRGRSPLYRWLWENYPELERARQHAGMRSDWVAVAAEISKAGIKGRNGKRLEAETVRRTWARVSTDAKAAGRLPASTASLPPPAPTPPPPDLAARPRFPAPPSVKPEPAPPTADDDDLDLRTLSGRKI